MTERLQLDLPVLLPDVKDTRDKCVERLIATLEGAREVEDVHVDDGTSGGPARLCLHYNPQITNMSRIRSLAEAAGAQITEQYQHMLWKVAGIAHARRARTVAETLRRLDGVVEAAVSPGLVRVEFDRTRLDAKRLIDELANLGVTHLAASAPTPPAASATGRASGDDHGPDDGHDHGAHEHGGPFGAKSELIFAVLSAALWLLGFLLDLTVGVGEPILIMIFVIAGLFGGYFTLREAVDSIRNKRFEIDFLMLVAAAGAAVLGKWEEGALLLALFSVGHALEGYAMGRARRAIEALAELAPTTATIRDGAREREVLVEELAVGDLVLVRPNERIPADGFVVAGTSSVNQAALTGESIPVDKQPVDNPQAATANPESVPTQSRVLSGTINGAGQLDVEVTRLANDSTLSRLAKLVQEAETQTSPTQRFTDRFERAFVPGVLGLVVVVMFASPAFGTSFSEAFYRAMAVLVAASPCALAIATPSAVLAAVARAGQLGVLIKGGGPLEQLGTLDAIAFDKTGTLTEGRPRLTDVVAAEGVAESELLGVAVAIETRSDHPLAAAVVRDGTGKLNGASVPIAAGVTAVTGRGVTGVVDSKQIQIGNVAMFADDGGINERLAAAVEELQANGRTIMIVRSDDRFLGALGLMDTPRPKAKDAIASIQKVGIRRVIMLSGDNQRVATSVAQQVGLTEAWGDLMPDDKVRAIQRLLDEEGQVAMVGDGVNDAPALAHATVGIAMGAAGSDVALETADIALMGDDLAKLPAVVELSRRASRIIRQNLYISLGMVAVLIPTTIVGYVGIGPAVIAHEGSTLVVVANALRLLAWRDRSRN